MNADITISKFLLERIKSTEDEMISLDTALVFQWDKLLIVKPYITEAELLRYKPDISNLSQLDFSDKRYNDGINTLVFITKKKAVRLLELPQYPCCNFSFRGDSEILLLISKNTPVFNITKKVEGKQTSYTLELRK